MMRRRRLWKTLPVALALLAAACTGGGGGSTGAQAANYTLTLQNAASATITAKALTAQGTLALSSKVYNGTASATPTGAAALQTAEASPQASLAIQARSRIPQCDFDPNRPLQSRWRQQLPARWSSCPACDSTKGMMRSQ